MPTTLLLRKTRPSLWIVGAGYLLGNLGKTDFRLIFVGGFQSEFLEHVEEVERGGHLLRRLAGSVQAGGFGMHHGNRAGGVPPIQRFYLGANRVENRVFFVGHFGAAEEQQKNGEKYEPAAEPRPATELKSGGRNPGTVRARRFTVGRDEKRRCVQRVSSESDRDVEKDDTATQLS